MLGPPCIASSLGSENLWETTPEMPPFDLSYRNIRLCPLYPELLQEGFPLLSKSKGDCARFRRWQHASGNGCFQGKSQGLLVGFPDRAESMQAFPRKSAGSVDRTRDPLLGTAPELCLFALTT